MSKLKAIYTQVDEWFKDLRDNPAISQFSLNSLGNIENEESELDSLAKDLEELIEDEHPKKNAKKEQEIEIYYFKSYSSDELTLTDPGVGHCCTLEDSINRRNKLLAIARNINLSGTNPTQYSAVITSHFDCDSNHVNFNTGSNKNQFCDLKMITQTPTPRYHDYLARDPSPPGNFGRIPLRRFKSCKLADSNSTESPSVLNTIIIKRFAKFSEKLRILSGQACN